MNDYKQNTYNSSAIASERENIRIDYSGNQYY
jgi:hypothetical protein